MDTQILSPASEDHFSSLQSLLIVDAAQGPGSLAWVVDSEVLILGGRVANRVLNGTRVANRVAKQLWSPVFLRIPMNLLFDAGGRVHATLFATLMRIFVPVENTRGLRVHADEGTD